MYNEIWTYCQWSDIAKRDVTSFFILGLSLHFSSKIKWQLLNITAIRVWCLTGEEHFKLWTYVYTFFLFFLPVHVCLLTHARISGFYMCIVIASSQWSQCILGLLIIPCLQPSCCLHVTMETLVAIHEPITVEKEMLKSCMLRKLICLCISHVAYLPVVLHRFFFLCNVSFKQGSLVHNLLKLLMTDLIS